MTFQSEGQDRVEKEIWHFEKFYVFFCFLLRMSLNIRYFKIRMFYQQQNKPAFEVWFSCLYE